MLFRSVMVSRVLGFSTHLDFLVVANEAAVKAGAVLAAAGLLMSGFGRRRGAPGGGPGAVGARADNAGRVRIHKAK